MDLGKTLTDGLTGAAVGLTGGPIGAVVGLLGGVAPDLFGLIAPHLAGAHGAEVAQAVMTAVGAVAGDNPTAAAVAGLTPELRASLSAQLATIALQAEQAKLTDAASDRATVLATLQATLGDVANARSQTLSLAQNGTRETWTPAILSYLVIGMAFLGSGALVWLLLASQGVPTVVVAIVSNVSGSMWALAGAAAQYWLGSSSGSARKDVMLYNSRPAAQ
jgi:hypothetical protein